MTEEERRQRLRELGYDPDKYDLLTPLESAQRRTTMGSAALTGVKQSVGPTAGGAAGALLGAKVGAVGGPIGALAGSLIGGIAGGFGGGAVQSAVEEAALDEADQAALMLERQAAAQKYPTTTFFSQVAPSLLLARPSLTQLKALPGAIKNAPLRTQSALEKYALTNAGISSGLEAGVEAGTQAIRGEEMDYSRIALAGLVGGALTQPTAIGKKIYGSAEAPLPDKVRDASGNLVNNPALMEQLAATRSRVFEEKEASAAEKQLELDIQAKEAEQAANDSARADAETAKRDETTASEDKESARLLKEESITLNREFETAQKKQKALEKETEALRQQHGSDHILVRNKQTEALKALEDVVTVRERILEHNRARKNAQNEKYTQEQEAADLAERAARREQAITGKEQKVPSPADTLRAAKGLAERIGMSWRAAIPQVVKMANTETTDELRGIYSVAEHAAAINEKTATPDTPIHEVTHGVFQVMKRSENLKDQEIISFLENDLIKSGPEFDKLETAQEKRILAEELIVEGAGRVLTKRLNEAPKGVVNKFKRYIDDLILAREARKGFPKKDLQRISEWLAMRVERQPALQPQQLELFLKDLPVPNIVTKSDGSNAAEEGGGLFDDRMRTQKKKERYYTDEEIAKEFGRIREAIEKEHGLKASKPLVDDAKRIFNKIQQDHRRLQKIDEGKTADAFEVASMYDPALKGKYSKRVRSKMSVDQIHKALARFASRPFPEDMSGEDIAKVVNGMPMYHGTRLENLPNIRQEGFRGEELSPSGRMGRGIYMTHDKNFAATYGEGAQSAAIFSDHILTVRTNFKKLFDLDKNYSANDAIKFIDSYLDTVKRLGSESGAGDDILKAPKDFRKTVYDKLLEMPTRDVSEVQDFLIRKKRSFSGKRLLNNLLAISSAGYGKPTDANHVKVLNAMGYDGINQIGAGEVVAFREPFEKADDTLKEFYTGQRLQRKEGGIKGGDSYGIEDYFKKLNDYQLTSGTDHFSSNPSILHGFKLTSVVDSIRLVGKSIEEKKYANQVADALDATARDSRELQGRFIESLMLQIAGKKLSPKDAELLQTYMVYKRAGDEIPADVQQAYDAPNSMIRHYHKVLSDAYRDSGKVMVSEGIKVYSRNTGEYRERLLDKDYVPETINATKLRELQGDAGAAEQRNARDELIKYWKSARKDADMITDEDLEIAANRYITKSTDFDNDLGSSKFGAVRKVQGLGLPRTRDKATGKLVWIEPSAVNNYTRYFKRFADDVAFYRNVEKNSTVSALLGVAHEGVHGARIENSPFVTPTKKEIVEGREVILNAGMTSHPAVRDFMKGYLGYYDGSELIGRTANRVVTSHWLGLMSGIRDLFTSYTLALPYLSWNNASALAKSFTTWKENWSNSHLYGVNKAQSNRIEFGLESHSALLDYADKWSDVMARLSGRNALERSTRALQFGLGRAVTLQNLTLPDTNRTAMRTLQTLSKMSGVDYKRLRRHADNETPANKDFKLSKKELDDELNKMAAAWVEVNQGTYDVRGVPSWTLFGAPSLFTSLSRWTVEKTTRMERDILNPLLNEGDPRPLLKATLGALFTGYVLQEVSEEVYNKLQGSPTFEESLKAENREEATYAVVNMLNQSGYFGLVSALLNDWARAEQGYNPDIPGGFVFPAYDFFTNTLTDPLLDAARAIEEGAPALATLNDAIFGQHGVVTKSTQTYRIMMQQTFLRDEMSDMNMRRDYRVFRRLEGFKDAPVSPEMGNKFMRPATREFKEAETLEEMYQNLPKALDEQIERANGRSDKLKSYVQGMYTTSDKTMPSVKTDEGVEEFLRYRQYMMDLGRGKDWQRTFNEWARRKQMAPARKALVKSYVQHRVATGG